MSLGREDYSRAGETPNAYSYQGPNATSAVMMELRLILFMKMCWGVAAKGSVVF